jgi:hypothetical protein
MGKRGPAAVPDDVKTLRGTDRKDRAHPRIVPALPGEPVMPEWLEGLGGQGSHCPAGVSSAARLLACYTARG